MAVPEHIQQAAAQWLQWEESGLANSAAEITALLQGLGFFVSLSLFLSLCFSRQTLSLSLFACVSEPFLPSLSCLAETHNLEEHCQSRVSADLLQCNDLSFHS